MIIDTDNVFDTFPYFANLRNAHGPQELDWGEIVTQALQNPECTTFEFKQGNYKLKTPIAIPSGKTLRGIGGQRATLIICRNIGSTYSPASGEAGPLTTPDGEAYGVGVFNGEDIKIQQLRFTRDEESTMHPVSAILISAAQRVSVEDVDMERLGWANGICIVESSTDVSIQRVIIRKCDASNIHVCYDTQEGKKRVRCQVTGIDIHSSYPEDPENDNLQVCARIKNVRIHGLTGVMHESDGITVGGRVEIVGDPHGEDIPGPDYDGPLQGVAIADVEEGIDVQGLFGLYRYIRIARVGTGFKLVHGAHRNQFDSNIITEPRCFGFLLRGRGWDSQNGQNLPPPSEYRMETSYNKFRDNLIRRVNWDHQCGEATPRAAAITLGIQLAAITAVHHNSFCRTTIDCPDPNRATVVSFHDHQEQAELRTRENVISETILRGLPDGVDKSKLIQYHPDSFGAQNSVDPLISGDDPPSCSCG